MDGDQKFKMDTSSLSACGNPQEYLGQLIRWEFSGTVRESKRARDTPASLVIIKITRLDGITQRKNMQREGEVSSTLGNITLKGRPLKQELRPGGKGSAAATGRKPKGISHGNPVLRECKTVLAKSLAERQMYVALKL